MDPKTGTLNLPPKATPRDLERVVVSEITPGSIYARIVVLHLVLLGGRRDGG